MKYTSNIKITLTALSLSAMLFTSLPAQELAAESPDQTATLIAVLTSPDATIFERTTACRELSIVGDQRAVPVLASLLADEKLGAYARWALEGIPGPEADAAIRASLSRLEGKRLIGVLGSIGAARDVQAIESVAALLDSDDSAVVSAAARTLGHIGTPATAAILQAKLPATPPGLRPVFGNACLICIQRLTNDGEVEKAIALCDAVQDADLPMHITSAAAYDAILALGDKGLPRLAAMLASDHELRFRLALQASRQLDVDTSSLLVASFKNQAPARQVLLLIALGDLGNEASLPTVLEAAKSGEGDVRIEAVRTLAKLGDASVVPVLLAAATDSDEKLAAAARWTLAALDSGDINAKIVELLGDDNAETCLMAIDMVTQRKIASATPVLLRLANSKDTSIRTSAIKALGSTAELDNLDDLIALAIAGQGTDDFAIIQSALKSASVRMPQEACAARLSAAMAGKPTAARVFLLEQLASVGGTTALQTVVAAAKSDEEPMLDAATRLLGEWLTADAAPAMLDLAKTLPEGKYQIRALRGYVRVARQLEMTTAERLTVCRNTLAIARRSADRVLVLEVFRRYPTVEGLALATSLLAEKDLQEPACVVIASMAGQVALKSPEQAEEALQQVLKLTNNPAVKADAEKAMAVVRDALSLKVDEAEFTPLFDGVSLNGWKQAGKVFRVEDGAIVGGSLEKAIGKGNDYLCLDGDYDNFELRLEARLKGSDFPNGGIQLRSSRAEASGYQADLGVGYYGCLYDEVRRQRMLAFANPKQNIPTGQWVAYRIRCEGPRIRIWINGTQTVDYTEKEPGIATTGAIGLQSHANHASETWYRNIRIKKLEVDNPAHESELESQPEPTPTPDEDEFTALFDGKTLDGWKGNMDFWSVADGEIVGGSLTEMVKNNEFLRTKKEYADFELRLQFKLLGERTNGGVQVRTQEIPNHHEVIGYQADLGNGCWGCLYDESRRRKFLAGPPAAEQTKPVHIGEWNDYRIRCEGRRIQLWINDVRTVDYTEPDPSIPQKGIIAIQVHGNIKMKAHYRNIRIKEL